MRWWHHSHYWQRKIKSGLKKRSQKGRRRLGIQKVPRHTQVWTTLSIQAPRPPANMFVTLSRVQWILCKHTRAKKTPRCHVAHPSLSPTRSTKRQWENRSGIHSDIMVVIGCPGCSGGKMNVKKERDTPMGHTLAFKNNPEEDAPWVAKWSKGQKKMWTLSCS